MKEFIIKKQIQICWRKLVLALILLFATCATFIGQSQITRAAGTPFAPGPGVVFISQGIYPNNPNNHATQLEQVISSDASNSLQFSNIGAPYAPGYNALGYNSTNNYLYAIGIDAPTADHLLQIDSTGTVTDLGSITGLPGSGTASYNSGSFGLDVTPNILYILEAAATQTLYAIDVSAPTPTATAIPLSRAVPNLADFACANGFMWAIYAGGTAATAAQHGMYRINFQTGQVDFYPASSLNFGSAFNWNTESFGAQWFYGNKNLGISGNTDGRIYQISIANPTTTPTFSLVSSTSGPNSSTNDGASYIGVPIDLSILKTGPATYTPGSTVNYTLRVKNEDLQNSSSGSILTDQLGTEFSNITTTATDCSVTGQTLSCTFGQLAPGAWIDVDLSATVSANFTGNLSNTATILGNDLDPTPGNNTSTSTATQDIPQPTPQTVVVSFEPNGGTPVDSQTIDKGATATDPADPVRNGYTFDGWYTDDGTFIDLYDFNTPVNNDITLYAKWTPVPVTISFEPNGGSPVDPQTIDKGATATDPSDPIRGGYTFDGWYTDDGTFIDLYDFNTPVNNDITLYAKWTPVPIVTPPVVPPVTPPREPRSPSPVVVVEAPNTGIFLTSIPTFREPVFF